MLGRNCHIEQNGPIFNLHLFNGAALAYIRTLRVIVFYTSINHEDVHHRVNLKKIEIMDSSSIVEAIQGSLSVDQFEHYIKEWSKQNEDRDVVYQVSDIKDFITLACLANPE